MPSSNPAFSRFGDAGNGQQNPGWGAQPQPNGAPGQYGTPTQYDPYSAPSPYAATTTRYLTMDDVVTKTGITFLVTVLAAAAIWALPGDMGWSLALPALVVGLVLGLVITFKTVMNPAATLAYAAIEGVFLGAISEAFNSIYPGIVTQAVIGTFGVFAGMLLVYKTGAIRVTPKLTRWVVGAGIGVLVLMLANLLAAWIGGGDGLGLRSGGPLAIVFSLVVIGVAAFFLLLDFDLADDAIRRGAPAKFAWYIAFGLLVTVVWLYLEILRLLSYFRD
ncbi:Bax inhibitor-1/YccA family protein [Blastococcus sp. CT_GayMR16]|uniref:Bax inhibitor-1/YccA family protein n=1 Tax=Blastococcus sp. CT_GayMR16 TaxID=2559607 RepID=UPI001073A02C|nr:Bax inhibitor-1/YccA family protein [Blastococcus sp. CT_GayMR16]TFV83016.1 Bax inhibitor-1/YccA family protein [Blastococcus sp. CT_GayMR16]